MYGEFSEATIELLLLLKDEELFKQCGNSGISDWKKCWKGVASHQGVHLAQAVTAWKVGKVVGQTAAAYLESQYGIDREVAGKLAETFVQGTVATGLAMAAKDISDPKGVIRRALTEYAAAFVGKTAHGAAENALTSREMSNMIKQAGPVLAGKFSGIGTAIAGSKVPSAAQIADMVVKRSVADTTRMMDFFKGAKFSLNFSEESVNKDQIHTLVDLYMIAAMAAMKEM